MAADYVVKKHASFVFAFADDTEGKTYELPSVQSLSFDDAELFINIKEKGIREQGEGMKAFVQKYNPELKDKDIGDMQYLFILQEYIASQNISKGQSLGE